MGMFDKFEGRLERAVNGAFAKAFRSGVEPVEIASAVRRAMDDRAARLGRGRTIVPNYFSVELSPTDYDKLVGYEDDIEREVAASAQEHAETQAYQIPGPLRIDLTCEEELETGVFRVRPSTDKNPPARHHADVEDEPGNDDAFAGIWDEQPEASADDPNDPYVEEHGERYEDDAYDEPAPIMSAKDRPWLEIDGDRYPLLGPTVVLGRDESADIILDDGSISRRHCEIRTTTDGPRSVFTLRDLGSTNGTFVNGDRIPSQHVHDGDTITIGKTRMTFRAGRR